MLNYNKVILGGVACNTPELRQNGGGTSVTNFTLKTVETWRDKNTHQIKKYSKYHKIVAWGKTAERAVRLIKKDTIVLVEGKLNYHKNGDKRNVAEIKAYVIDKKGTLRPKAPYQKHNIPENSKDEDINKVTVERQT